MPAVGEVQQLVDSVSVRPLVEIHHLHVAVGEGCLGEVEFRFAVNLEEQRVAGAVNAEVGTTQPSSSAISSLSCQTSRSRAGSETA